MNHPIHSEGLDKSGAGIRSTSGDILKDESFKRMELYKGGNSL